jgi:glycosyltransferase involved in cell wall biosynthesis
MKFLDKTRRKKIIFWTPTGRMGASSRYRVIQYFDYLGKYNYNHFSFMDDHTYKIFKKNKLFYTIMRTLFLLLKPLKLLFLLRKDDVLFIHRDVYPFGPIFIEKILKIKKVKIIMDLDDAIFLNDTAEISNSKNKLLYKLKYGSRYNSLIKLSEVVICGNEYLEDYCSRFNNNTVIIPTVIDKNRIPNKNIRNKKDGIMFGWIGNPGNSAYFKKLFPIFDKIATEREIKITFRCIGGKVDYKTSNSLLRIEELKWEEVTEYDNLNEIDVGIMPLEDSEWSKGKCGLKLLQYMCLSKVSIADAVGVNKNIINHGYNGFLTNSIDDWYKSINACVDLLQSDSLDQMGNRAYVTFDKGYSLQENLSKFKNVLDKALQGGNLQ